MRGFYGAGRKIIPYFEGVSGGLIRRWSVMVTHKDAIGVSDPLQYLTGDEGVGSCPLTSSVNEVAGLCSIEVPCCPIWYGVCVQDFY